MSMFIVMGEAGPIQNYEGPNVFLNPNFHTRPEISQPQPVAAAPPPTRRRVVCRYFRVGICKKGPNCPFLHTLEAAPNDGCQTQAAAPSMECPKYPTRVEETVSQEKKCCICLENVLDSRASTSGRKFGLLENCDHCYCHQCIMGWWKQRRHSADTRRYCPTCRAPFCLITPSMHWPESAEKKRVLTEKFRKKLKSKPCVFFNEGRGVCTSGNSCFYSHALPVMKEEVRSVSTQERVTKEKKDEPNSNPQENPATTDDLPSGIARMTGERIPVGRSSSTAPASAVADLPPAMLSNTAPARGFNPHSGGQGSSATPASVDDDLSPGRMDERAPAGISNPHSGGEVSSATPASVDSDLPPGMMIKTSNEAPAKTFSPQSGGEVFSATPASVADNLPPRMRGVMRKKRPAKASKQQSGGQLTSTTPASVDKDSTLGMTSERTPAGVSNPQSEGQGSSATSASVADDLPPRMRGVMKKKRPAKAYKQQSGGQLTSTAPASVADDLPPRMRVKMNNEKPPKPSKPQSGGQGSSATPASVDDDLPPRMRGVMKKKETSQGF